MTERHTGYVVYLDAAMREDDARQVLDAISMIKGVAGVTPVVHEASAAAIATLRRDGEWYEALFALIGRGPESPETGRSR